MKSLSFIKKATTSFVGVALAAGIFFSAGTVNAIPYTGDRTVSSPTPAFNVFTGVDQGVGNESDFFRSRAVTTETDATTPYTDPLNASCDVGQLIQMRVYVHNGASAAGNNNGSGPSVAHDTRVKVDLQEGEHSTFDNTATISSSNAGTVTDHAIVNCNGKVVKLSFKSASAFSAGTGVVNLTDALIKDGVSISSHGVAGDVWGCWDDRVYVVLNLKVEEVKQEVPLYTCDLVTPTKLSDNKFRFVVKYTATNGATFKNVSFSTNDGITFAGNTDTTEYTFPAFNGDKTVTATVNFTVNGQNQSKSNEKCVVVVNSKITPPVTPPTTPKVLPKTGAGSTIAIFGAATVLGTFLYRLRVLRGAK